MANRMNGKVGVVTGAASGMGKAITLEFLREGAKIVATDMNEVRLQELVEEVNDLGLQENLRVIKGNVCTDADCEAAVKLCVDTFGEMNVLSHNAGVSDDFTLVHEMNNDSWNRILNINLTGTMKICRAALNYFLPNEVEASMVLITSNAAFESATGGPAYSASKAGANALMKAIAFEYGRNGIRCNSICPGPVVTNITESAPERNVEGEAVHLKSGYNSDAWKWTGGVMGFPEDIAHLATYLASDESTFMNGNSCVIDGGVCLSR